MEDNKELLAKAHSLRQHLGKMRKAVSSFHEHMQKAHSAHHADMVKAFGHLHKLVGIEPGEQEEYGATGGEPKGVSPEAAGTKNLQDFGGGEGSDVGKAAKKGDKGGDMTKAEMSSMFEEMMAKLEKRQDDQFEAMLKAITGGDEGGDPNQQVQSPTFQKAAGVGDRTQLRQPVQQVVTKTEQQQPLEVTQQAVQITPELMQKALQGDEEARRLVMKSALPQEVPQTLIAPLSKIH